MDLKRLLLPIQQVDVYSFGVVLWEICTGRVPTRGRLADPDVPGDCPADILMLIRECMQAGSISPACTLRSLLQRTCPPAQ